MANSSATPESKPQTPPAVDYTKLFNEKCDKHTEAFKGKEGHNVFIFLRSYEDIRASIMNNKPFTPEQIARITCEWPAPRV